MPAGFRCPGRECATAHFGARTIGALGHDVKLVPPAYVKPFVKRQKNDAADAEAIAEAASRPTMRFVEPELVSIDAVIEALIADDAVLSRRRQVLMSIPGLGAITIYALLADIPELGSMEEGQAAALAGLAPMTQQSGKWSGRSAIRGGRAMLRQALYMPALVAMRFNPDLKRVYDRLATKGKHAKIAITLPLCESSSSSPTRCFATIASGPQKRLDHNGYSRSHLAKAL